MVQYIAMGTIEVLMAEHVAIGHIAKNLSFDVNYFRSFALYFSNYHMEAWERIFVPGSFFCCVFQDSYNNLQKPGK